MTDFINVRIDYREVVEAINQLSRRTSDMTPAMKLVGLFAVSSVQGNFERQSSPDDVPWAPLARPRARNIAATTRRLARLGFAATGREVPHQILVDKGLLVGGIHSEAYPDRAVVSTSSQTDAYAAIHNFGGRAGRKGASLIPQREYMGLRMEDQSEIAGIIDRYLQSQGDQATGQA